MRRILTMSLLAANGLVLATSLSWAFGLLGHDDAAQPNVRTLPALPYSASNAALTSENPMRYAAAPLFRKDRAFAKTPQAPVAAAPQSFGPPRAIGTILSSETGPWVLLVHPNTQQTEKVALGSSFAGWDVAAVSETAVQLRRDGQFLQLDIRP